MRSANISKKPEKSQVFMFINAQRWSDAKAECTRVCNANKGDAEAWFLLGAINGQMGIASEAERCCRRAVALQPEFAQAYYNLGIALRDQGKLNEAAESLDTATRKMPTFVQAYSDLAFVLLALKEPKQAANAYRTGLRYAPDAPDGHANLGMALYLSGELEEAAKCLRKAIDLRPGQAAFHDQLAIILCCQGRIKEALVNHKEAQRLKPNDAKISSNYLLSLHYDESQSVGSIYTEHRRWGSLHVKRAVVSDDYANIRIPERKLRVGYVSADFRHHSVAYFFEPLLISHDRSVIEVFLYSAVTSPDKVTTRFHQLCDHWRDISTMNDAHVADLIQDDAIDILVDLSGHTAGNRLGVFAQKPAPIQVTYLGYPDTTGLPTMDYRITDDQADPLGTTEQFHSEKLLRIGEGFLCYLPMDDAPEHKYSENAEGHITFGSFNNLAKINEHVISIWSEILHAVPLSKLVIKNNALSDPKTRAGYYALFQGHGISQEQVELLGLIQSPAEHVALYNQIDIALDTFPYNGTTTTCEALWMGVPVITYAGKTHASRVGASLLSQLGLRELIATDVQQYVNLAVALAIDRERLPYLHRSLRERMRQSPLCDAIGFTGRIENAYRAVWKDWCATVTANDHY